MPNAKLDYPLEQVLDIKKKRVQDAEKKLKEAQEELEREKEILKQKEKARDKVLKHRNDKLAQMREEMDLVDATTTSNKIQQMKDYLKVVDKKLVEEEKKVEEQKQQVEAAEQQVERAREELKLRRLEVDKLNMHKDDWLAMMREELRRLEDLELDEIGSIMYLKQLRESKSENQGV